MGRISDGTVVAIVTGGFLICTKLFDWLAAKYGKGIDAAVAREQRLYDRIATLEARIDEADALHGSRVTQLETQIDALREANWNLRKQVDEQP